LRLLTSSALLLTAILCASILTAAVPSIGIVSPEKHFGFRPGADGKLIDYSQLIGYLKILDESSPRVTLREAGLTPLGRKMYILFISSNGNIAGLDGLRDINERLALDPGIPDSDRDTLIDKGRVFFLATLSMHSGEVGPSQALPIIAFDLATSTDPEVLRWLDDVVYMTTPCHNPDGMDMTVEHYRKYHGTKYDGASMPGLYHKYVGHDNNRDFVTLSQSDTKVISAVFSTIWYPQVMVEKHQMGSTGVRYFVPPTNDPIAENIDAGIWNWAGIFGMNMIKDMTEAGQAGVAQHYLFDDYWPGSTETCNWKNVISFLTEGASVNYATPIYVEPNELAVHGKGLSEYKKSVNMPLPWPGGWWRLSDIVDYEISSTRSIIKTSSEHRKEILTFRNDLCRREVERGRTEAPFYFVMPRNQRDRSELAELVDLLLEHGVKVSRLSSSVKVGGRDLSEGDIVVSMAQPYRPFAKEVLERQQFPLRHYTPDGEVIRPYDITSWSLPLHMGVDAFEIDERSSDLENALSPVTGGTLYRADLPGDCGGAVFAAGDNESFRAAFKALGEKLDVFRLTVPAKIEGRRFEAGAFILPGSLKSDKALDGLVSSLSVTPFFTKGDPRGGIPAESLKRMEMPRIALVETWFHDMDAGWTRYIFDTYGIPFEVLRPGDFEKTDLSKKYDAILFPNNDKDMLMSGKWKRGDSYYVSSYPPEYVKGLGKKGMERLTAYLDEGGMIVAWGRSVELFAGTLEIRKGKEEDDKEEFSLPFDDISDRMEKEGFYCPGAMLRIDLIPGNPLTWGMPLEAGALFSRGTAFRTSLPRFDMDRRIIAKYPEKDILLSGYIEKEKAICDRSAMIWMRKGKGQIVLFGFNPQFRASTAGTYKLLFNALLLGDADSMPSP
jgi:hypothetical protein